MILFGCLLAFGASVAPRVFLVLAWIFSERWQRVWQGDFLLPLLGIIFLPYTTIMYLLVWTPAGIAGWDYIWIILGLFLDLWKWVQVWANREKGLEVAQSYYSTGGGTPTGGGGTTGAGTSGTGTTSTGTTSTGTTSTGTTSTGSTGTGSTGDDTPA